MTNTEAQQVLGTMLMRYDLTDAELEAIGMAGEALEDDWISIEEGLPDDGEIVMTYRPKTHGEHKMITEHFVRYINGRTAWLGDAPERGPVTHWRHLPKGPEVEPC